MTLEVRGLVTGYAHARVLHGVDLDVGDGEFVSVLGPNGSGKTTLLRAIAGVLPAWDGTIVFDGRELQRAKPWHRARAGLAHVPDGRGLFAPMTVWENLWVAAGDTEKARSRLDETWELFPELRAKLDQTAGSLSGGQQQMLAIARALIAKPKLVLIDELSAGLAPIVAQRLVESLRYAGDESDVRVLLVEQNPHIVREIVDRVYVLEQGRVVASGSMDDVGGIEGIAEMYLGADGAKPRRRRPTKTRTRKERVK